MSVIKNCIKLGLVIATLPSITLASDATAQQSAKARYAQEIGASERVNFSGKLRMLSQRVVATSCTFAAGIEPQKTGHDMRAAKGEFTLIVDALENGNSHIGIHGAEKRRKTRAQIDLLKDKWMPVALNIDAVNTLPSEAANVATVADLSAPLLDSAKLLVSELSAQYSDPAAMLQADAMLIDISGRQRMLIQRMSKNACLIASGINSDAAKTELSATLKLFETSLTALRSGMPDAGIKAPPTTQISEGLAVVATNWNALKPAVITLLDDGTLSLEDRPTVSQGMTQRTGKMKKVGTFY